MGKRVRKDTSTSKGGRRDQRRTRSMDGLRKIKECGGGRQRGRSVEGCVREEREGKVHNVEAYRRESERDTVNGRGNRGKNIEAKGAKLNKREGKPARVSIWREKEKRKEKGN